MVKVWICENLIRELRGEEFIRKKIMAAVSFLLLIFGTAKVASVTAMIFFRIILHPASHIWYSYIHNFIIITIIVIIIIIIIIYYPIKTFQPLKGLAKIAGTFDVVMLCTVGNARSAKQRSHLKITAKQIAYHSECVLSCHKCSLWNLLQ